MAWARIDDGFFRNPKIQRLSHPAGWLYIAGIVYSARELTDGALSDRAVKILLAEANAEREHVDELVRAGLWEMNGPTAYVPDALYHIHDYLAYHASRQEVLEERRKNAEKQAQWRARQGEQPASQTIQPRSSNPVTTPVSNPDPIPSHTHPIPIPSDPIPVHWAVGSGEPPRTPPRDVLQGIRRAFQGKGKIAPQTYTAFEDLYLRAGEHAERFLPLLNDCMAHNWSVGFTLDRMRDAVEGREPWTLKAGRIVKLQRSELGHDPADAAAVAQANKRQLEKLGGA